MKLGINTAQPRVSFSGGPQVALALQKALESSIHADYWTRVADTCQLASRHNGAADMALELAVQDPVFCETFSVAFRSLPKHMKDLFKSDKARINAVDAFRRSLLESIELHNVSVPEKRLDKLFSSLKSKIQGAKTKVSNKIMF